MADLRNYWILVAAAVIVRLLLIFFAGELSLATRPEVTTPVTSLRRLAEGYWLKQSNMSPYSGSMYHGSPLLLFILGPLTVKSDFEGQPAYIFCSLIFVIVDFIAAMLIRATGQKLLVAYRQSMQLFNLLKESESSVVSDILNAGELASLIYLWNPLSIITCIGSSTSPVDNLMVVLTIYGASAGITPLAAFGWVMATHLSLYPVVLVIPVVFLLGYGLDAPPQKLFQLTRLSENDAVRRNIGSRKQSSFPIFSWRPVINFIVWASVWSFYVLFLSTISLKGFDGLVEMLRKTHGFILTVEDLSPNIGVLWYFFAEVFDFFRNFFLIVFQINILFMILPLAIRLKHRPCFLAFVYIAISAMLKSYPSVGDSALYLGLLGLFANELADMHFSFLLFCGYVGVSLLGPVMHNLWIWRGTGNSNFYFATGMAYACLQTVLIVESVSTMLNHDRKLRKSMTTKD